MSFYLHIDIQTVVRPSQGSLTGCNKKAVRYRRHNGYMEERTFGFTLPLYSSVHLTSEAYSISGWIKFFFASDCWDSWSHRCSRNAAPRAPVTCGQYIQNNRVRHWEFEDFKGSGLGIEKQMQLGPLPFRIGGVVTTDLKSVYDQRSQ